jgi:hypothetical protein
MDTQCPLLLLRWFSPCLCSSDWCVAIYRPTTLKPETLGVALTDNQSFTFLFRHLTTTPVVLGTCSVGFSQSYHSPHSTRNLPPCISTIPCQSSLYDYLCFHGNQVLKEKGVQTNTPKWLGDSGSCIRLLSVHQRQSEIPPGFEVRKIEVEVSENLDSG